MRQRSVRALFSEGGGKEEGRRDRICVSESGRKKGQVKIHKMTERKRACKGQLSMGRKKEQTA